jgi:hypothetical protein
MRGKGVGVVAWKAQSGGSVVLKQDPPEGACIASVFFLARLQGIFYRQPYRQQTLCCLNKL